MKSLTVPMSIAFVFLTACSSLPPTEVEKLNYESALSPRQVYELVTERCGTKPYESSWTNGAGNGFGVEGRFDTGTNSGTITYYHISFGTRSEPGSFWDKTFGQVVRISPSPNGTKVELRGETAEHLMRDKYRSIGAALEKKPVCPQ